MTDITRREPSSSPLHSPTRRFDVAFAALDGIAEGGYVTCLAINGQKPEPPASLLQRLSSHHWLHTDEHPLTYVDPQDHFRIHQAWLDACQGEERVGRARVRTTVSLDPPHGPVGPPGWYEVLIVDLLGVTSFEAIVVRLIPATPRPNGDEVLDETYDTPTRAVSWFRGTSSFRLRLGPRGIIEGGTLNVEDVVGRSLDDLIGSAVLELAHPDDQAQAVQDWLAITATPNQLPPRRLRIAVAEGGWRWFEITSWNLLDLAQFEVIISDFRDVQEQVEAEQAREVSSRALDRLVTVLDEIDDIVMVGRLDHGLVYLNAVATSALGGGALGRLLVDQVSSTLQDFVNESIVPALRELRRWTGEIEVEVGGHKRLMATTVSPVAEPGNDDDIYYGVIMRDVTKERAHATTLADQARRDPLTGLPNRLALMEQLEACRRSGPGDGPVSVCFIDLDNLKIVNDGLGHSAGDQLLRAVGTQLLARHQGTLARFGGDEFVVVLEDASPLEAARVAQGILGDIERVQVPGIAARVTASIGVAASLRRDLDPESVIRDADAAMYVAKRSGRARVVEFDETMRQVAARRFHLETALRDALDHDQLAVHLQPIVALATDQLSGFEALARWDEAPPNEFVPVAEESGLISNLGRWALRSSLEAIARVHALHPDYRELRIGVNVSGHQLLDHDFSDLVLGALDEFGVAHHHLVLELTESVLIDPREEIDGVLTGLCDAGVSLALDDFGSGYSSLGYLRRYPIDVLKLDNSYTQALLHDPGTRIIAEGIVTMANRLGLRVVAEGVETQEQLDVVRNLGIDWAQGYLLGRPVAIESVVDRLATSDGDLDITPCE